MRRSEAEIRASIRANERLAREYAEIGDLDGFLRCDARVQSLKSGLAWRKKENEK